MVIIKKIKKFISDLKKELDNTQKEFILKEKIKFIKRELGEKSGKEVEVDEIYEQLNKQKYPENIKNRINNYFYRENPSNSRFTKIYTKTIMEL